MLLAWLPETPLRLLIGALPLLAAALLRSGFSLALEPSAGVRFSVGMASGFVNGVAAIGGIAIAVMLSSSRIAPAAMRAGIWVGQRSFVGVSPAQFRRHVLNLLLLIAAISVLRALVELLGR